MFCSYILLLLARLQALMVFYKAHLLSQLLGYAYQKRPLLRSISAINEKEVRAVSVRRIFFHDFPIGLVELLEF